MKDKLVSVPSRGVRYLNKYDELPETLKRDGFRPLTGSKVSEPI